MDALDILDIALLRRLDESGLEQQILFSLDGSYDDAAFMCEAVLLQMQQEETLEDELISEELFSDIAHDDHLHDDYLHVCLSEEEKFSKVKDETHDHEQEALQEKPHWHH